MNGFGTTWGRVINNRILFINVLWAFNMSKFFLNAYKYILGHVNVKENFKGTSHFIFCKYHWNVAFKCSLRQAVTLKKLDECPAKWFRKTFHECCTNNVFMLTFWAHYKKPDNVEQTSITNITEMFVQNFWTKTLPENWPKFWECSLLAGR